MKRVIKVGSWERGQIHDERKQTMKETHAEWMRFISISLHVVNKDGDHGLWIKLPTVPLVGERIFVHGEHGTKPREFQVTARFFYHWHDDDDTRERVELNVSELPA